MTTTLPGDWLVLDNLMLRHRGDDVDEIVATNETGISLSYLLDDAPTGLTAGDDLGLVLTLETDLDIFVTDDGVYLIDALGNGVLLGEAIAHDGVDTSPVTVTPTPDGLVLTADGSWLETATYPVLVDMPIERYLHSGDGGRHAEIAYNPDENEALGVFVDISDTTAGNVVARLYDATDGDYDPLEDLTVSTDGRDPVVIYNPDGDSGPEYLVVYLEGDGTDLAAQRIDAETGLAVGTPIVLQTIGEGTGGLSLALDPDTDKALLTWHEQGGDPASLDIKGLLILPTGLADDVAFDIAATADDEYDPSVTFDPDLGDYVVVWTRLDATSGRVIEATTVEDDVTVTVDSTLLDVESSAGDAGQPQVAYSAAAG